MRLSHPLSLALIAAVIIGGAVALLHPTFVMTAYAADFARLNYQGGFPPSFQRYLDYRYVLGILFGLATLGAVYFGLTVKTVERWVLVAGFLGLLLLNYLGLMPPSYRIALFFFLSPLWIILLLIRAFLLYRRGNRDLFRSYCFCLLFNGFALPLLYMHFYRVLDIIFD